MNEPEKERSVYNVPKESYVAETVSVDAFVEPSVEKFATAQSLYDDSGNEPIQSFHNNHKGDELGYDEDRFEATIDTDKKEHDMKEFKAFEDVSNSMESVKADIVKADVSTDEETITKSTELIVEEQVEQIAETFQKYYKFYDYLSAENKAMAVQFQN